MSNNKLVKDSCGYPLGWRAYDTQGKYMGKIEKDQYGAWRLFDQRGAVLYNYLDDYRAARKELTELSGR